MANAAEQRFQRSIIVVMLLSGVLIAAIGIAQRFGGNGKILWSLVPQDWGTTNPGTSLRASGPFINPNHFASFLALIFPLALACALGKLRLFATTANYGFQVCAGFAVLLLTSAILLSLSRIGWVNVAAGSVLMLCFFAYAGQASEPRSRRQTTRAVILAGIGALALIGCGIMLIGPEGSQALWSRLADTMNDDIGIVGRLSLWGDTASMIADYPLLGVGLGAWAELYPSYQSTPWTAVFYREAHNDYVQIIAETGFIGALALSLLAYRLIQLFARGDRYGRGATQPLFIVAVAALLGLAIHEHFDFNLQIPAIALWASVMLGLAVRLTARRIAPPMPSTTAIRFHGPVTAAAIAMALFSLVFSQEATFQPAIAASPQTVAGAVEQIRAYPARPLAHIGLAQLMDTEQAGTEQLHEFAIAHRLSPTNPHLHDLYARALIRTGKRSEGLREIARSIEHTPTLTDHFYFAPRIFSWLSVKEKQAIEQGFTRAIEKKTPDAVEQLADFYQRGQRHVERARLLAANMEQAPSQEIKIKRALGAAQSYIAAGRLGEAESVLRQWIVQRPTDPEPYRQLAELVYAPAGNLAAVHRVIALGITNAAPAFPLALSLAVALHKMDATTAVDAALEQARNEIALAHAAGNDRFPLYRAFAETAAKVGRHDSERQALEHALELRPTATDVLARLGMLFNENKQYDRAAWAYQRFAQLSPLSADIYFQLGLAEESRYGFAAAEAAFARAVSLAPEVDLYRKKHQELLQRIALNRNEPNP